MIILPQFMLPTQAAGAMVLDGTSLIAIGSLIICYFVYKNLKSNSNAQAVPVSNDNTNMLTDKKTTHDANKQKMSFAHQVTEENKNVNVNENTITDQTVVKNDKKELVFNHR